jgi:hypothetical protein
MCCLKSHTSVQHSNLHEVALVSDLLLLTMMMMLPLLHMQYLSQTQSILCLTAMQQQQCMVRH